MLTHSFFILIFALIVACSAHTITELKQTLTLAEQDVLSFSTRSSVTHVVSLSPPIAYVVGENGANYKLTRLLDITSDHAIQHGVCIAVFVDSMSNDDNLIGCLGTRQSCWPDTRLSRCTFVDPLDEHVLDVITAYQWVHLLVKAPANAAFDIAYTATTSKRVCNLVAASIRGSSTLTITRKEPDPISIAIKQNPQLHIDATVVPLITVDIAATIDRIFPSRTFDLIAWSDTCASKTPVVYRKLLSSGDVFDVNYTVFMHPPENAVVVSFPVLSPYIAPDSLVVHVSLYATDYAANTFVLVHDMSRWSHSTDDFVLKGRCMGLHYVTVSVFHIQGTPLAERRVYFNPESICLASGHDSHCFCREGELHTARRGVEVRNISASDIQFGPTINGASTVVSYALSASNGPFQSCRMLDLVTGAEYWGYSDCYVLVPAGSYILSVYYEALHIYVREASETLIICDIGIPSTKYSPANPLTDTKAYLEISTGITCPRPPSDQHATRSSQSVAISEPVTFDSFFERAYIIEPPRGLHSIGVRLYAGENNTLVKIYVLDVSLSYADSIPTYTPVYCKYAKASLTYNHLPRFATDHSAFATLAITDNSYDKNKHVAWAWRATPSEPWIAITSSTLTVTKRLESGVHYDFQLSKSVYESADSILATSACYLDGGHIVPEPLYYIRVNAPVEVVQCSMGTVVIFSIDTNIAIEDEYSINYDIFYPFSAVPIDAIDPSAFLFAAGPVDLDSYAKESLVMTFKIGTTGQIVVTDLDDMITARLYPMPDEYDFISVSDNDGHDALFHCGLEDTAHSVSITTRNPSTISEEIYVNSRPVVPLSSSTQGYVRTYVIGVDPSPLGSDDPLAISIGLRTGISSIMSGICKPFVVDFQVTPYIPNTISYTMVPLEDTPDDILCAGKRNVRFSIPASAKHVVSYHTVDDEDLGATAVVDGAVFAIRTKRVDKDMRFDTYYNPTNNYMGANLQCAAYAHIEEASWEIYPAGMLFDAHTSDVTITLFGKNFAESYSMQLATLDGTALLHREYPSSPLDGVYRYAQLNSGVYIGTLTTTYSASQQRSVVCRTSDFFFVENTKDAKFIQPLVDMDRTTSGDTKMACPFSMFGEQQTWVNYYSVALHKDKFEALVADGSVFSVRMWRKGSTAPVALQFKNGDGVVRYRIPAPGEYTAEIVVETDETSYSHSLPKYTVTEPAFTEESFVMEVVHFPTCIGSTDGVIRITYPATLHVAAHSMGCKAMFGGGLCDRMLAIDQSNAGTIFISKLPFLAKLTMRYEIMGACTFDTYYSLSPTQELHPHITSLEYTPSCQLLSTVNALFGSVLITGGHGKSFAWSIDGTKVSDDDTLAINPRTLVAAHAQLLELEITYNGVCKTYKNMSIADVNLYIPPVVRIDPLLFGIKQTRSLPVFCPRANDAMLVATFDPPLSDSASFEWTMDGIPLDASSYKLADAQTVRLFGIGAGLYSLHYQTISPSGDLTCVSSDIAIVSEKMDYNLLDHLSITRSACANGLTSAELDAADDGCDYPPEVNAFYAEMLIKTEDRKYIKDRGNGATSITDVPNGHVVRINIPYPHAYSYIERSFCLRPLAIDFGYIPPYPILSTAPVNSDDLFLYIPRWYVDAATIELHDNAELTIVDPVCTLAIKTKDSGRNYNEWTNVIAPVVQHMACPYTQPLPVDVYNMYRFTADRFYKQTLDPLAYATTLSAIDPNFAVIYPPAPRIKTKTIVDLYCNLSPTMHVDLDLRDDVDEDFFVDPRAITVDNAPADCMHVGEPHVVRCTMSRTDAFYITIPYTSSSNGSCVVIDTLYDLVEQARTAVPAIVLPSGNASHVYIYESTESLCAFYYAMATPVDGEAPIAPMQIMHPSCHGASDGAVVWKLGNETVVKNSLAAGAVWLEYPSADGTGSMYSIATLREPDPINYVVQPAGFPAPPFGKRPSMVTGMPSAMADDVDAIVYIHGGSDATKVTITATPLDAHANQPRVVDCPVAQREDIFWKYACTAVLSPGYSYDFSVSCGAAAARRSDATKTRIANAVSIESAIVIEKRPSTDCSRDGRITMVVNSGVPPFTYVFNNEVLQTTQRRVVYGELAASSVLVVAVDATGSTTVATTQLQALYMFAHLSVKLVKQYGCGADTHAVVEVIMVRGEVDPVSIGAWNQLSTEQAIASCSDPRMIKGARRLVLDGAGLWFAYACAPASQTPLMATEGFAVAETPMTTAYTLSVQTVQTCFNIQHGVRVYRNKGTAEVLTASGHGPFRLFSPRGEVYSDSNVFELPALSPGLYHYDLVDGNECHSDVAVGFADTGKDVCGTCGEESALACIGCDGVAFSGAVYDDCGVCNGDNACFHDCVIDAEQGGGNAGYVSEMQYCAAQGRMIAVRVPVTVSRVTITASDVFSVDGPVSFVDYNTIHARKVYLTHVLVRDVLQIYASHVEIDSSEIADAELRISQPQKQQRRAAIAGESVTIVIRNSAVQHSTLPSSPTFDVTVANSSFVDISIEGGYGNQSMYLDYNSTMETLDITGVNITGLNVTVDELACILFVSVPSLQTIYRDDAALQRATYTCTGFGASSDSSAGSDENEGLISITVLLIYALLVLAVLGVLKIYNENVR